MSRKRAKLSPNPEATTHHSHGVKHNTEHQQDKQPQPQLIPDLPDHIAHLILSRLPPSLLFSVSLPWRRLLYSSLFPPFLSLYAILAPSPSPTSSPQSIQFSSFDPISSQWQWLPDPPIDLLLRHPSFISRNLPIQTLTVSNRLIVVAATSHNLLPALQRPLVFDPLRSGWGFGPDLSVPRRWCAAGSVKGTVYVTSGVGTHFSTSTSRLAERWDITRHQGGGAWERAMALKDGKFAREAVDAVGWKGKLCLVNVGAKEGAVYDTRREEWVEMAEGMVEGWRGPAASMAEEELYLVDGIKGVLRMYEEGRDSWVDVAENERLRGAQQIAAGGGRVCAVARDGGGIIVVDVTAAPAITWVVEPPPGYKVVAVHILPRMSATNTIPP